MRYALVVMTAMSLAVLAAVPEPAPGGAETRPVRREGVASIQAVNNGVEMSLSMAKSVRAGEHMVLEVALRNVGKETVRYGPTDAGYMDFQILIVDGGGRPVPLTRLGEKSKVSTRPTEFFKFSPKPLQPGQSYTVAFNLALAYDLTLRGNYRVSAATEIFPPASRRNGKGFVVKATGLAFEVTSPAPPAKTRPPRPKAEKKAPPAGG